MQIAKQSESEIWFKGYGSDQYVFYARKGPELFLGDAVEGPSQKWFKK
jgi:hypothetical protein